MTDHISEAASMFIQGNNFQIVGDIAAEYASSWESCQGILYVGSKGMYFLGSYFLFERKLVVYWDDVRLVQKVDQGVEIVCKNDQKHYFSGIHGPDRAWSLLVTLHNDALLDRKGKRATPRSSVLRRTNSDPWDTSIRTDDFFAIGSVPEDSNNEPPSQQLESSTKKQAPTRRSSTASISSSLLESNGGKPSVDDTSNQSKSIKPSDIHTVTGPLRLQPVTCTFGKVHGKLYMGERAVFFLGQGFFFWEKKSLTIQWEEVLRIQAIDTVMDRPGETTPVQVCTGLRFLVRENEAAMEFTSVDNAYKVWTSAISMHSEKLLEKSTKPRVHRRMNSDPLRGSICNFDYNNLDDDKNEVPQFSEKYSNTGGDSRVPKDSPPPPPDVRTEWLNSRDGGKLSNVIVKDQPLKCSLDIFFQTFVGDNAPNSISRFMEKRGDRGLRALEWSQAGQHSALSRVVSYTHPVNVPLAPPEAAARKEQTYRRYADYGLILETKTFVDDVPMADCFYVTDRIIVEPHAKNKDEILVGLEFGITFVKSTMFKGIISKTTESEMIGFIKDYAAFMASTLGEVTFPTTTAAVAVPIAEQSGTAQSRSEGVVIPFLILLVLLIQIWVIVEIRGMKTLLLRQSQTCPATYPVVTESALNGVGE